MNAVMVSVHIVGAGETEGTDQVVDAARFYTLPEVNDSERVANALRARRVLLPPGVLQRVCQNSFACSGDGPDG